MCDINICINKYSFITIIHQSTLFLMLNLYWRLRENILRLRYKDLPYSRVFNSETKRWARNFLIIWRYMFYFGEKLLSGLYVKFKMGFWHPPSVWTKPQLPECSQWMEEMSYQTLGHTKPLATIQHCNHNPGGWPHAYPQIFPIS